ncbi:hypothetical protein L1049_012898 [Liquidambar formosana]|uniref:Uncharacterized protein n=1 Tax=Liquidambar formosana TaxID=63359 RepID=A0AAP0WXI3_LIQFO
MMELKGTTFVPQFRVGLPQITRLLAKRAKRLTVSSSFGETFPVSYSRRKTLEVHCDNSQSIQHSALSRGDSSRLSELSFNRLQLSDQDYCGLQSRNFGRFIAREAVLDEEYWTAAWLRAEAHWESLSYMRHIDSYKRKYAEQLDLHKIHPWFDLANAFLAQYRFNTEMAPDRFELDKALQQLDLKLSKKKCLTQHISPYVLGCNDYKLQSNYENVVPFACVEHTISPMTCSDIQDQKPIVDEPEPMQQEGDSSHEPMLAIEDLDVVH